MRKEYIDSSLLSPLILKMDTPSGTSISWDFGLNLLATGRVGPTIRISVVMRPLNFSFFNSDDRLF